MPALKMQTSTTAETRMRSHLPESRTTALGPSLAAVPRSAHPLLSLQRLAGNRAVARALAASADDATTVARLRANDVGPATLVAQRVKTTATKKSTSKKMGATGAIAKRKPRKKSRKGANTSLRESKYATVEVDRTVTPWVVSTVKLTDRPPSSSRGKQGDHIVAYSLMASAVVTATVGKSLPDAAKSLNDLLDSSRRFVTDAGVNRWWYDTAQALQVGLTAIADSKSLGEVQQMAFKDLVSSCLALLNSMPGTAISNVASTGGHGEGGNKGGLMFVEGELRKGNGKVIPGNPWGNILGLIDLGADKSMLKKPDKVTRKLQQLIFFTKRAAPRLTELLKAGDHTQIPETNLDVALKATLTKVNRPDLKDLAAKAIKDELAA